MSTERFNSERSGSGGRAVHDVGGLDFGPIDRHEHDLAHWERRIDALLMLLATRKGAFKIDALRRVIESYSEQDYDATTYYEKWVRAIRNLLIEQEIVTMEEIEAKCAEVAAVMRAAGREVIAGGVPADGDRGAR
ncbi:MAG: nitrile hydratase subunit beta [Rhizobiales bacterium]|nr:nitrile hydratase subunit beta [Hyphomicrobiales bacterium]